MKKIFWFILTVMIIISFVPDFYTSEEQKGFIVLGAIGIFIFSIGILTFSLAVITFNSWYLEDAKNIGTLFMILAIPFSYVMSLLLIKIGWQFWMKDTVPYFLGIGSTLVFIVNILYNKNSLKIKKWKK